MLAQIVDGVVTGAVYGLWRYYNNKQQADINGTANKPEFQFDKIKFCKTLVIGGIIGAVAAYTGVTVEIAFGNEMLYFGSVVVVEEAIKTIKRFLQKRGIL